MTARRTSALFVLAVAAGAVAGRVTAGGPGTITLIGLSALALLVSAFLPSGHGGTRRGQRTPAGARPAAATPDRPTADPGSLGRGAACVSPGVTRAYTRDVATAGSVRSAGRSGGRVCRCRRRSSAVPGRLRAAQHRHRRRELDRLQPAQQRARVGHARVAGDGSDLRQPDEVRDHPPQCVGAGMPSASSIST